MLMMWQSGIKEVVYALNGSKPKMIDNKEYINLSEKFIEMSGMKISGEIANTSAYKKFISDISK